jgi:vancomycin permeability regulator SanA
MLKKFWKFLWRFALTLSLLGLFGLILPRFILVLYAKPRTFSAKDVSPRRVAIVFGAGLWRYGTPTPVLRDRVQTAANLYFDGKVDKLLMSGDNSVVEYNEPEAMRQYALSLDVPDKPFYTLNIFGADGSPYTREELAAQGWAVSALVPATMQ